jgi:hypothetical protein
MTRPLFVAFGLLLFVNACGPQPGPADAGSTACSPVLQTGCASDAKCTVRPDTGASACGPKGASGSYALCAADAECISGTICLSLPAGNAAFEGGQRCRPLCNPMTGAHLACSLGGTCELVDRTDPSVGFCARPTGADGGP